MKTFHCICGQLTFFDNVSCVHCGRELGFLPDLLTLAALEPAGKDIFAAALPGQEKNAPNGARYRKCRNYAQESVCNWLVPESESGEVLCRSCRLTETIPDLSKPENRGLWAATESAKRGLLYGLIHLRLPISGRRKDPAQGLAFRFLSDVINPDGTSTRVLTGYENGIITLNIAEADDGFREKNRVAMHEPYRTLLGHFRHETGHFYWDRLIREGEFLNRFRELFGDERADYAAALQQHYAQGAPPDWQERCVSAYATAHPWEDWAETWAHYLHIQDTLEVACDFGIRGKPQLQSKPRGEDSSPAENSPAKPASGILPAGASPSGAFDRLISNWLDLTVALNSINRSMGHRDLYPFVLTPKVIEKLRFISDVIVKSAA